MLWGFVVVTTSVAKVTKRKVSHRLLVELEFLHSRAAAEGVEGEEKAIRTQLKAARMSPTMRRLQPFAQFPSDSLKHEAAEQFPPVSNSVKIVAGDGNI